MSRTCDTQVLLKGNSIQGTRPRRKAVVFVLNNKTPRNGKAERIPDKPALNESRVGEHESINEESRENIQESRVQESCVPSPLPPIPGALTETTDYVLKHNYTHPVQLWRSASVVSNNPEKQETGITQTENIPDESHRRAGSCTRKKLRRTNAIYIKRIPTDANVDTWAEEQLCALPVHDGFHQGQMSVQGRISSASNHDVMISRRHTFQDGRMRDPLAGDIGMDGRPPGRRGRVKRTTSAMMRPGSILTFPDNVQFPEGPEHRKNNTPVSPTHSHTGTTLGAGSQKPLRKKLLNVTPESTVLSQYIQLDDSGRTEQNGRCSRSNSAVVRSPSRIASAKDLSRIHRLVMQSTAQVDTTNINNNTNTHPRENSAIMRYGSSKFRPDAAANTATESVNVKRSESNKIRPDTANTNTDSDTKSMLKRPAPVRRTSKSIMRVSDLPRDSATKHDGHPRNNPLGDQHFLTSASTMKYGRTTFITTIKPNPNLRNMKTNVTVVAPRSQAKSKVNDVIVTVPQQSHLGSMSTIKDLDIVQWLSECEGRPKKQVAFKLADDNGKEEILTEYFL